ncbi:MAG: dehydrogenase [Caldilineaceae bacterium SB0661_bin_32]|uniref:Dehydrogenase n=1 Tax=Caldilineaceae bacterium SB0661_bin_32 TaxID=2605255 RepID=A0A6B1DAK0_9CHLR|nr:dehydrogenase [Caldilineaceae bacterium SB0661_bin_32]
MPQPFRIGVSSGFKTAAPGTIEPVLERLIDPLPHVDWAFFDAGGGPVRADAIAGFEGVIALGSPYDASTVAGNKDLACLARWGVGYDLVDTAALTANDILLAIAVDAVRKPVSEAILTLILALAKKLWAKDRLVRTGRWDLKAQTSGLGLSGKTVGSVGMGNIGGEMFRLLGPFDLGRRLAHDPYLDPKRAEALDVELVSLETIFSESDFVVTNCPLTEETRGFINGRLFALMKPSAYFINTARGPIVNQEDLVSALQAGTIAGAGLDVVEPEPLPLDHPLIQMDNVILSPHALAWTDDLYEMNGTIACESLLAVFRGELPAFPVNGEVIEQPGFRGKLEGLAARWREFEE